MGTTTLQNNAALCATLKQVDITSRGFDALAKVDAYGHQTLSLLVEGMYCAACIHKIESAMLDMDGVKSARLNFSTGSLNIKWSGFPALADDLVTAIENLGYTVHPYNPATERSIAETEDRFLLLCLGVAGFSMGNIMLLSIGLWITSPQDMGIATRDFLHLISAAIAVPTVLFSGRPFFRSAFNALRARTTNMDVPISVGLVLATGISLFETFRHGTHAYFDSAVMLIFFLLIGRYLDFRARRIATSAARDLMQNLNGFATVLENNTPRKFPIRDLRAGMMISVAAGEKFPADSCVEAGESSIDTALVTGETIPVDVKLGSLVYAGTLNLSGPLVLRVLKPAEESMLADIVRLMEQAEQSQSRYVRLADKAATVYTPVVHTMAALAFLYWYFIVGLAWPAALMIAATVLIITCPCALGLAVPVVHVLAISRLMQNGIMVKSGDALERLATIGTVIFDKTGTLTEGKPVLKDTYNPQDLQIAASLAAHSKHVLAQALTSEYKGELFPLSNIQEHSGLGLEAAYNGHHIRLGRSSWCGDTNAKAHEGPEIWLKIEDQKSVHFQFIDSLRPDAQTVLDELHKDHIKTILLSGDRMPEVTRIAKILGIDEFYGEKNPKEKYNLLQDIKKRGQKVLMVGDGLNDAPVLMGADAAIAPGEAIDLAQNSADVVFLGRNLNPILLALRVARQTQILVKQNFALAVLYNMIAIPLAFSGYVTPLIAALAMSGSSLLVVANAFRLRWTA